MDEIDIAEFSSRESARFSLQNLDSARARAHALLLLLLGGGGGLGAAGLNQLQGNVSLGTAALMAAAFWFWLAYSLAQNALVSAPVRSWAAPGLIEKSEEWRTFATESAVEGKQVNAVAELRKTAIRTAERAAEEYRQASGRAYAAMDNAYRLMATTPLAAAFGAVLPWAAQRLGIGLS